MVYYWLVLLLLASGTRTHPTMFEEDMAALGYPFETHHVVTEDKFILTVFRLRSKINKDQGYGNQPVLLVHGLDESAHGWIINDPDKALGTVLADQGYDVWMLNNRGTVYSRHHLEHTIDSKEIWDFSFQEMAEYDIVSTIKMITEKTDGKKIIALGHSQGAVQVLAAMADPLLSDYVQDRLLGLVGLSPVTQISDVHYKTQWIYDLLNMFVTLHSMTGFNYPFLSSSTHTLYKRSMSLACHYLPWFCSSILAVPGLQLEYTRPDMIGKVMQVFPGGASFRCYLHFEQLSRIGDRGQPILRKYDFGSSEENYKRYGREEPPLYDFGLIRKPIRMHSGNEDILVTPSSLKRFESYMKKLDKDVELRLHGSWDHFSVLVSKDPAAVFGHILDDIKLLEKSEHCVHALADQ